MNRFTIRKLTVSGGGHQDSIIEFTDGLNIIIGPSNTGKSLIMDCIDYVFGFTPKVNRPSKIVDNSNGYTHVELELKTDKGSVSLKREIGTTKVSVISHHSEIESGSYSSDRNAKKNINDIFLKLIGINDVHKVLSSQKGSTQSLTWRSILHLFFMKQNDIDRESSALLSPNAMGSTSSAAALLYLLTGKDANDFQKPEDPTISVAKRNAIIMYIRDRRDQLSQKREELEKLLSEHDISDAQSMIDKISSEIQTLQSELNNATQKSKKIMLEIYQQNSKLSECNTVLYNFHSLSKQYQSDVKRLGFIVDGQIASSRHRLVSRCPFCDAELKADPREDYVTAAATELTKLGKHISELSDAQASAERKKKLIEDRIASLEEEKNVLDSYITNELQPKISTFKSELDKNLQIIRWQDELERIHQEEVQYSADLFKKETEEDPKEVKYNILTSYEYDLVNGFEKELISALKSSNFGGSSSARLNMKSFDIEIDGHSKPTCMGGGYSAVLNALTIYAMTNYIYKKKGYAPGFLALDSALSQLSEAEHIKTEDSIKYGFIQFLISNALDRQVIVIEHKDKIPFVPKTDITKGIHVTEFTKNKRSGRYGFLNDVVNPEDK